MHAGGAQVAVFFEVRLRSLPQWALATHGFASARSETSARPLHSLRSPRRFS
jgi:hypothetical protein